MNKKFNELVILMIISNGLHNGTSILHTLKGVNIKMPDGSLYTLLGEMRKDSLVRFALGETDTGSSKKCYILTAKGVSKLSDLREIFKKEQEIISSLAS